MEHNEVQRSYVGIHVNYSTTQGGIVVEDNIEPPGVPANYNPYVRD